MTNIIKLYMNKYNVWLVQIKIQFNIHRTFELNIFQRRRFEFDSNLEERAWFEYEFNNLTQNPRTNILVFDSINCQPLPPLAADSWPKKTHPSFSPYFSNSRRSLHVCNFFSLGKLSRLASIQWQLTKAKPILCQLDFLSSSFCHFGRQKFSFSY